MPRLISFLVPLFALAASTTDAAADVILKNPLLRQRADPHVFLHADGQYYFTATVPEYDRIEIRRTRDLNLLATAETKVIWRKHATGPLSKHIWAPEIHHIDGKWYIYFTASSVDAIWEIRPQVLMNESADPFTGEFIEMGRIKTGWESFSLDGTTFLHKGKRYFAWTQRGRTPEEGKGTNIYLALMKSPLEIETSRVALLSKPDFDWEKRKYEVNEGPAVLIRNGRIFMTFSASATNANYCVGMLTAFADADLLDPASWAKTSRPVLETNESALVFGPGHNSYTTTPDGNTDIFVYHAREYRDIVGHELDDPNRHTRAQVLRWNADGTPNFGDAVASSQRSK
jgi:GH43 family beta-xylosidase